MDSSTRVIILFFAFTIVAAHEGNHGFWYSRWYPPQPQQQNQGYPAYPPYYWGWQWNRDYSGRNRMNYNYMGGPCCNATVRIGCRVCTCQPEGGVCGANADCCNKLCNGGRCATSAISCRMCFATCLTNGECCSLNCAQGKCQPRGYGACSTMGKQCNWRRMCCDGRCYGTRCMSGPQPSCLPYGSYCLTHDGCCTGFCTQQRTCGRRFPCKAVAQNCTQNTECCSMKCEDEKCADPNVPFFVPGNVACRRVGDFCTTPSQCCSIDCQDNRCKHFTGCRAVGSSCVRYSDCCSGTCMNGFCSLKANGCMQNGAFCRDTTVCCSRICMNGLCAATMGEA